MGCSAVTPPSSHQGWLTLSSFGFSCSCQKYKVKSFLLFFSPLQEMYLIQTKEIKSSYSVLELKLLCTYVQERLLPPWSI